MWTSPQSLNTKKMFSLLLCCAQRWGGLRPRPWGAVLISLRIACKTWNYVFMIRFSFSVFEYASKTRSREQNIFECETPTQCKKSKLHFDVSFEQFNFFCCFRNFIFNFLLLVAICRTFFFSSRTMRWSYSKCRN